MMRMRHHPVVKSKSLHEQIGYDEAEDLIRGDARRGDAAAKQACKEIDDAEAKMKADAIALNQKMAGKLGMTMDQATALVKHLHDNPDLENWLLRRVNLTRAHGRELTHEEHHFNSND